MFAYAGLPFVGSGNRGNTPWNARMWWSYGEVSGDAWLRRYTADNTSNEAATVATWDHLGLTGVIGMPFIVGNILIYASDQTGTGVATYDISDPSNPVLLDVLKEGNPGGYWPELYGHYIFFPRRNNEGGRVQKPVSWWWIIVTPLILRWSPMSKYLALISMCNSKMNLPL